MSGFFHFGNIQMHSSALTSEQKEKARADWSPTRTFNAMAFPDPNQALSSHSNRDSYRTDPITHCQVEFSGIKSVTGFTTHRPLVKSTSQAAGPCWQWEFNCCHGMRTLKENLFMLTWESMDTVVTPVLLQSGCYRGIIVATQNLKGLISIRVHVEKALSWIIFWPVIF